MLELLKDWKGEIDINDKHYDSVERARSDFKRISDDVHIILHSSVKRASSAKIEALESVSKEYKIEVKAYMTRKATLEFDFMAKWNNDNPMPMRIMQGVIEKETKGMVYMRLHGLAKPTITCYCCGKELTNPISRHYGIGPICLSKLGIARDIEDVENIKEDLVNIVWAGWVIKSAIISKEEI